MRLINVRTKELVEHFYPLPVYAILSHTWGTQEVTLEELELAAKTPHLGLSTAADAVRSKSGFKKITKCCERALQDRLEWAWVDTCCIDKTSGSELSEAINSMFSWYKQAAICYVYLEDFSIETTSNNFAINAQLAGDLQPFIQHCAWFRRGWTLQELIAPLHVQFHDKEWRPFGTRNTLRSAISSITKIDEEVLRSYRSGLRDIDSLLRNLPVARRMAWAAGRVTKKPEDASYSLMGIFGVNMPMLYGEGMRRAFVRLQEEILKDTNDLSLLAWRSSRSTDQGNSGVFAETPADFQNLESLVLNSDPIFNPEFSMTNKGLSISAWRQPSNENGNLLILWLGCHLESEPSQALGIYLTAPVGGVCIRTNASTLCKLQRASNLEAAPPTQFYIAKYVPNLRTNRPIIRFQFQLKSFIRVETAPSTFWDESNRLFVTSGEDEVVGFHYFKTLENYLEEFFLVFGYAKGAQSEPWYHVAKPPSYVFEAAKAKNMATLERLGKSAPAPVKMELQIRLYTMDGHPGEKLLIDFTRVKVSQGGQDNFLISVVEKPYSIFRKRNR